MNLKGIPESTNFQDRSAAPWYDPHKILGNIMVEVARLSGNAKQAQIDKNSQIERDNPIPVRTPQQEQADWNAKVSRDPNGRGWTIKRPGQFDEFAPDYVDSNEIQNVLKQAGLTK